MSTIITDAIIRGEKTVDSVKRLRYGIPIFSHVNIDARDGISVMHSYNMSSVTEVVRGGIIVSFTTPNKKTSYSPHGALDIYSGDSTVNLSIKSNTLNSTPTLKSTARLHMHAKPINATVANSWHYRFYSITVV